MFQIKHYLFICCCVLMSTSSWAQKNLIANGQFVEGTKNWNVLLTDKDHPIKAHIEHGSSYKEYGLADNFIGTNFVELDEKSAIQQVVKTQKGELYTLVFAYAHRPEAGTKQLIVTVDGKAVYTKTIANTAKAGAFMYQYISFQAPSDETKIGFYSASILGGAEDKGILLTDILCNVASEVDLKAYPIKL